MEQINNTDYLIHKLRNPYGRSKKEIKADRLEAAELLDLLSKHLREVEELHVEVGRLCEIICNTIPTRSINEQGRIDSIAFIIGHHPMILGS